MTEARSVRSWAVLLGTLVLAWWATATWIVPWVIRAAHAGTIPGLGNLMPGRDTRPVDGYLESWQVIARGSVVVVVSGAAMLLALLAVRQFARRRDRTLHPGPAPAGPAGLLLVAGWIGLLTGLVEAWYHLSRVFYQGLESAGRQWGGISQHAVWMSPLANLLTFALIGGLVALVAQAVGNRLEPKVWIAGLAGLACFALTMVTGRVHWAAAGVLAVGATIQLGRILSPGGGEVVALARRSIGWLVAGVLVLGVTVPGLERLRERRQLAGADTPAPGTPNVLFIVLDTERALSTSLHGSSLPTTPFLERLARRGIRFERAIAPSSWTLPSHAAMFTGREVRDLGVDYDTPLDDRHPVLAEVLSARGYATAGFVANPKFLTDLYGLGRGFGVWRDQPIQAGTLVGHSWLAQLLVRTLREARGDHQLLARKTADMVNVEFLDWLGNRPDRPFFAFLNYFDAHAPYLPPEPWNLRFAPSQPRYWIAEPKPGDYSPAELEQLKAAYASGIAYLDDRLMALFAALEDRGLLSNTLVVITSDHGEDLGEGSQVGHGHDLTMPLVHVPLVILGPGLVPAGVTVPAPVDLRSLATTILDLTVGEDPSIEGASLASSWSNLADSLSRPVLYATDGRITSVVTDSFQLLHARDGSERLFNHRQDPLGLHDLAGDPGHAETLAEHQRLLQARLDARP